MRQEPSGIALEEGCVRKQRPGQGRVCSLSSESLTSTMGATRADTFDPDERFTLPDDSDPYEVLKRLLGPDGGEQREDEEVRS